MQDMPPSSADFPRSSAPRGAAVSAFHEAAGAHRPNGALVAGDAPRGQAPLSSTRYHAPAPARLTPFSPMPRKLAGPAIALAAATPVGRQPAMDVSRSPSASAAPQRDTSFWAVVDYALGPPDGAPVELARERPPLAVEVPIRLSHLAAARGPLLFPPCAFPPWLPLPDTTDERVRNHRVIFGGSFNPPHWGTVGACIALLRGGAAQVVLMPAAVHAEKTNLAPFRQRLKMCEAVAAQVHQLTQSVHKRVAVSAIEARVASGGQSLIVLDHLQALGPKLPLSFALGSDYRHTAPSWPNWEQLQARYPVIFVSRGGYDDGDFDMGEYVPMNMSSTEVRRRRAVGEGVDECVPMAVADIIRRQRLYSVPPSTDPSVNSATCSTVLAKRI